ncbi:MBL fold metallo-hydrolase [Micromonospora mirobrigensis]|uniref:Ribonuclease BN, tRNA processing enzyme n=1 Tax=Micromonospora mirobrigensis TaxID=262898 RepID=A0A1C4TY68_9ACTN|nr:MBL fold metallo-hydrolase [Micromonospora mirobrigensis]SCE64337.1 Ribonuclease BN, tRNA processing enzyme [Micromonospora mirobrigensis]
MRITVLGGRGAWPGADQGCSGFLVEHGGFRLLVDPGYATVQPLLARLPAVAVDAVYVSHGHPDHCADLQPLLRARVLTDRAPAALPVYAPAGSLDALLAIDEPGLVDGAYRLCGFAPGEGFEVGPFAARTWALPHWVSNAGVRLTCPGGVLAYTGDTGPSPDLVELARDADLLIAEATYVDDIPDRHAGNLSSAAEVGRYAALAGARSVLLTHLWPGTEPTDAVAAARRAYGGPVDVAAPGLVRVLEP